MMIFFKKFFFVHLFIFGLHAQAWCAVGPNSAQMRCSDQKKQILLRDTQIILSVEQIELLNQKYQSMSKLRGSMILATASCARAFSSDNPELWLVAGASWCMVAVLSAQQELMIHQKLLNNFKKLKSLR